MKIWKKCLVHLLMVVMVLGFWGSTVLGATLNDDQTITLKIIHTNDTHSRYTYSVKNNTLGYAKLKTIINQENPDLIVDAGDIFHGQSFATIETGGSIAELMAAVGYDAIAPGNHDFNYGSQRLLELGTMANTKILGNNVVNSDSGTAFFHDEYLIKTIDVGGETVKIGVFGLISPDIYSDTAPSNVAGLSFGSREQTIAVARQAVAALKAQDCDVIVALTHIGDSDNGTLMRSDAIALGAPGIDVIVDGHTHDVENREVNGTLIVQTGCFYSAVGEVEITLEKNAGLLTHTENQEKTSSDQTTMAEAGTEESVAEPDGTTIEADVTPTNYTITSKSESLTTVAQATDELIPADPAVTALIAEIEAREEPIKKEVVGNTPVKLGGNTDNIWKDVRLGEINLGRVLADSYRFETNADIAVENAGGIRAEIPAGDINKGQVIDVLPFGNYLVTKKISGAEIKTMLETSIEIGVTNQIANDSNNNAWPSNSGSYLQWSGVTAQYDLSKPKGERVFAAKVGVAELNPEQLYTFACNNYLATNSNYPALANASTISEYAACDEAFISYLQTAGNERFMSAVNNPNVTPGTAPIVAPVGQKQSANNPKTGTRLWWDYLLQWLQSVVA